MGKISVDEIDDLTKQLLKFNQMLSTKAMITDGKVDENPKMKKSLANLAHSAITTKDNIDFLCKEYFGRTLDMYDISSLVFKNKLPDKK